MDDLWNSFDRWAFGTTRYECVSRYSLDESLARLAQVIQTKKVLGVHWQTGIVGTVRPDLVEASIQSGYNNSFKPVFRGRLQTIGGKVSLLGDISVVPFAKTFIVACLTAWLLMTISFLIARRPELWWFALVMPVFVIFILALGRALSSSQPRTIADALDAALAA